MQRQGGWLSPEKVSTLQKGVLAACDGLDGLKDGIISNIEACSKAFDPIALRCEGCQNTGDGCLSDAEIAVVKTIHAKYEFDFPLANAAVSRPGWGYGGETQPGGMKELLTGAKAPVFPPLSGTDSRSRPALAAVASGQSQGWLIGDGTVRYIFARDAKFDTPKFNPQTFASRIQQVSELLDATNPDLSAFKRRGGKLIMRTNLADYIVGPFATMDYYNAVVKVMGNDAVDQFIRYYVSPGSAHSGATFSGIDSAPVPTQADLLGVLESWVERDQAPPYRLTQSLHTKEAPFSVVAARPMCAYPTYPHSIGGGNPKDAESYQCREP